MNCYNPFSLEGKTILVTGASSGIGKATAIECSKMGAKLIITGRNEKRLNETMDSLAGIGHNTIIANLEKEEEIQTLVSTIEKIDGAVLCAGVGDSTLIPFASKKRFTLIFDTNLFAQTELIRILVKKKKLGLHPSIVAISSISAYVPTLGNGIYGASKAALSSWIKYAAQELGPKSIRINSICPGMVDTPLIHDGAISEDQMKEDMKNYALRRYGKPEEIAYACIYLLSDASAWVTGTNLVVDGGASL